MSVDTEALLSESGWVRSLARSLAADAQRAEDLAQDTLLAALQRPRAEGVPLRRWLAAVMRNLWRQERRGELRRGDREGRAARSGVDSREPAPDVLARLEGHRAVVEAVMGLHEPYRSAVVQRYFDGLAPQEIARRQGLGVRTVHTQLARALVLLRGRLERAHGEQAGAWLPILGLLMGAERPGSLLGTTLGAVLMDVKMKLAVGVVALAGLTFVARPLWQQPAAVEASPADATAVQRPASPAAQDPLTHELAPAAGEQREAVASAPLPSVASAPTPDAPLRVRAMDPTGRAVPDLAVRCGASGDGEDEVHHSDAEGFLELPCPGAHAALEVLDERWLLVSETSSWRRGADDVNLLVVARRVNLAGRVVDGQGAPLSGVQLRVFRPLFTHGDLPALVTGSLTHTWTTESDASGAFEFESGLLPGGKLVARRAGYRSDLRDQPAGSVLDLQIELQALEVGAELLSGHVIDERGYPVEGARVALGYQHTRSDADGRFLIHTEEDDPIGVLTALKPGSLPARLERAGDSSRDPAAWPDPLILQLGGPPLSIRGRVLDADGEPVSGADVRLLDPTHFGAVEWGDVEGITMQGFVEALLAGQVSRHEVRTDERGEFEIGGLLPRAYRLAVRHAPSLAYVESAAVEAGARGLLLRLPAQETWPRLAGRILSLSGAPVAGASVVLVGASPAGAGKGTGESLFGEARTTDAQGRFQFAEVPGAVTGVHVSGKGLGFGNDFALPAGGDLEDLEFRVARSCKLEVDLSESNLQAERMTLLDAAGEPLGITRTLGDMLLAGTDASFHEGRTGLLDASEAARTLVLHAAGVELLRMPVVLDPQQPTVIRP